MFGLAWLGDRILVAGNNQGQSLGRWMLNLKSVDMYYGKTSGMAELFKRELIVFPFLAVLLIAIKSPTSIAIFAVLPLVADAAFAIADSRKVQTLHDKLGKTIVISTRRGFQLDRKLAQIFTLIGRLPIPSIPKPDFTRRSSDDYFTMRPPKTAKRRPRKSR